jgi:hypothetical protein
VNLAQNQIGSPVLPEGWEYHPDNIPNAKYTFGGSGWQGHPPEGTTYPGVVAIANAIADMGALTSLNLSSNILKAEGGKIVAEAIKVTNNAMAVVLVPCPSDHWLNRCCLLLSTG